MRVGRLLQWRRRPVDAWPRVVVLVPPQQGHHSTVQHPPVPVPESPGGDAIPAVLPAPEPEQHDAHRQSPPRPRPVAREYPRDFRLVRGDFFIFPRGDCLLVLFSIVAERVGERDLGEWQFNRSIG